MWKYNLSKHSKYDKSKAAMKRAKWLAYCLEIGWDKHLLPRLEKVWDSYYNENGIRRPITIQEQPQHDPGSEIGILKQYNTNYAASMRGYEHRIAELEKELANYKNQSQEQPIESEDEWIKTATMWCEVVHTVLEAHKNNEEVGSFIPNVLEKQFIITRK